MKRPNTAYVGLYGSLSGDWRESVIRSLELTGLAWYDPTDTGWSGINADNGDARQAEIDALVARTQRALEEAACLIFHLAKRRVVDGRDTGETTVALAARCELGFIAGRGCRAFVHIAPDVDGRNFLWAYVAQYSATMTRCATLAEATTRAVDFMSRR